MKNLLKKLFFVFLLTLTNYIQAQYTDIINSNKPGFSESPYSVGKGVYQFESNFFLKDTSIEPTFTKPQSFGVDLLFRTSFFLEKLELNTQLTYQRDKVASKDIFNSYYFTSGLSKFTIGAKYLLFEPEYTDKTKEVRSWKRRNAFDKKRFIPSVAIYLGVNTDFVNDIHKTENITPKVGILLQHNLTNEFNVISNVYYDKIGSDFSEISYVITATQNIGSRWSGFLEHQGVFIKSQKNVNFGAGLAYLFSKDLQINASGRYLLEAEASGFYASLGISYRIDRHKDPYTELDEIGKPLKNTPITRYNDEQDAGFFARIFNFFKKKNKNSSARKRPTRNRQTRTKKKKSGFLGLFGKKKKKKETEVEKLEREIKELEKEVKEDDK